MIITKLSKLLAVSSMALACSAFAAGSTVPVQSVSPPGMSSASPATFFADLKGKLKINGAAQENAWATFIKGSERNIDLGAFQEIGRAKTTPDLMNAMEKMQLDAAGRFSEQKKVIVGLYNVLDPEQRKMFDAFVFATMAKMGAPNASR